jgi:hypothetical protein
MVALQRMFLRHVLGAAAQMRETDRLRRCPDASRERSLQSQDPAQSGRAERTGAEIRSTSGSSRLTGSTFSRWRASGKQLRCIGEWRRACMGCFGERREPMPKPISCVLGRRRSRTRRRRVTRPERPRGAACTRTTAVTPIRSGSRSAT